MKMDRLFPFLLLLILLAAAGYWVYARYLTAPNQVLQASGTIEAVTVSITAKTPGTIEAINLEEGGQVNREQLLIQLSRHDLSAQRERDAMAVAAAQANLDDMLSGTRSQEIKASSAAVNIARINSDKARTDLQRAEQLAQAGALSRDEFEAAQVNLELKLNQLEAAQAQLSLLQEGFRPDRIRAAEAEVARARALLKATDAVLEDLAIRSPLDGTVLSCHFEKGEYAAAGAVLATIADLKNLAIKVYVPADDLPQVKLGQAVHFNVSGSKDSFEGKVSHIASQGEFTPKSIQTKQERANVVFAVKIDIPNPDDILKPGMPADVVFDGSGHD